MKREKKIEPGAKFGKLKIICFAKWQREIILICQCECCQMVKISEAELKTRRACLNCESKKQLQKFRPGDVVIYRNAIGEIAFGEQVIVEGICELENALQIEYRGRIYNARPSELKKLGVNLYEKRKS